MPILLRLLFEELDANFRIVSFVCGCSERNGKPRGVCVFMDTKKIIENKN